MPGCAVPPCDFGNKRGKGKREVQTFPFPVGALRQKWIQQINTENYIPGEHSRVCERHFQETDYAPQVDSR